MTASPYVPERGEAVWLTLDPQHGREQAGRRPALVLSSAAYNRKTRLAIVCPITSRRKGYPFEVPLPPAVDVAGVVLADQVKRIDWEARSASFAARVPDRVVAEVVELIETLIGP